MFSIDRAARHTQQSEDERAVEDQEHKRYYDDGQKNWQPDSARHNLVPSRPRELGERTEGGRERVWVNITHTHKHTHVGKSMCDYAPGRRTESHAGAPAGARGVRLCAWAFRRR